MRARGDLLKVQIAMDRREGARVAARIWPELVPTLQAFEARRWADVHREGRALLQTAGADLQSRALVCHVGFLAAEIAYDLAEHARWSDDLRALKGCFENPYSLFFFTYHSGVRAFFSGSLREAEALFVQALECAEEHGLTPGKMRCHFQLGLVHRDRMEPMAALAEFRAANAQARALGAEFFARRIESQIAALTPNSEAREAPSAEPLQFARTRREILAMIRGNDVPGARRKLAQAEAYRRRYGLHRRRESLGSCLAAVAWARGRVAWGDRLCATLTDPIVRLNTLAWRRDLVGGTAAEETALKRLIGASELVSPGPSELRTGSAPDKIEVCGIRLGDVLNPQVRTVLHLFARSREQDVTKEMICREVWGIDYNPLQHENRIHKLVSSTRRTLRRPRAILNTYGAYRLNPDVLGRLAR